MKLLKLPRKRRNCETRRKEEEKKRLDFLGCLLASFILSHLWKISPITIPSRPIIVKTSSPTLAGFSVQQTILSPWPPPWDLEWVAQAFLREPVPEKLLVIVARITHTIWRASLITDMQHEFKQAVAVIDGEIHECEFKRKNLITRSSLLKG